MKENFATEKDSDRAKAGSKRREPVEREHAASEPTDFASLGERSGPELSVGKHAAVLTDRRLSHPANAAQRASMVSDLQRSMGNAYVQRVIGQIQCEKGASPAPKVIPAAQKAIREWLGANPGALSVVLRPEALCERIRQAVPDASGLSDTEIRSVVSQWRLSKGLSTGVMGPPTPTGGVPAPPVIPPKKEPLSPSGLEYRLKKVSDAFGKIPTKVEIKPSEGRTITVDVKGVKVSSVSGGITQTMGVGWNGSFQVGAMAGDLKFTASVKPDSYSFTLQIGPEVTAIDKLPGIVTKAEQGLRDLIGDIGALKLSSLDKVKESIGAISDHVKPIKEAVDACSKLEPKGSSVSFNLTAEFPRGEGKGGMSVMGMLTVRF